MKKNKLLVNILAVGAFIICTLVSFFAVVIITEKKEEKSNNRTKTTENVIESTTDTEAAVIVDESGTEAVGEHEHIWESIGHTETIDGKSRYIEDYQQCSICGERR